MYLLYVELQYKDMKKVMNDQILNEELQDELDQKEWVQDVVDKVYPHIVTTLGPSEYVEETPKVEIWNDIYARYSGIPEMRGEDSKKTKAEWKDEDNTIYVYYLNMVDVEDIIRSLLHEYAHSLQDPDPEKRKEQRELGYDDDPHEIEAYAAEESWGDYLKYLQDNPQVNVGDNVKIIETKLESKSDLLNETLLVIGFEDDGTPVTVNETDTLLESVTTHPTTINLVESELKWVKTKDIKQNITEVTSKDKLVNKFLKDFWPKYRNQVYSELYNTYHPSAYSESFNRPDTQFENALEVVGDAVNEGKKLGLLDSSVGWQDLYDYNDDSISHMEDTGEMPPNIVTDDNGLPTLRDQLEILDNTNLDWIHGILLFDVLEDIVDEFKSYCGENGVDESGMGKCMDEFPPSPDHEQINRTGGTLKQDYYTLYNFMKELERTGVNVKDYMKSPIFPNIIKLVDDGTTDYNATGEYSPMRQDSEDWDNTRTQIEFEMDAPDRLDEQLAMDGEGKPHPKFINVVKTIIRLMRQTGQTTRGGEMMGVEGRKRGTEELNIGTFTWDDFWSVLYTYFSYPKDGYAKEIANVVWLILKYNNDSSKGIPQDKLETPDLFKYDIRYKSDYSSWEKEEECSYEGFGEETGEDCECYQAVKYVKDDEGNERQEECQDEYEVGGANEGCECEEWETKYVEVYYYPLTEVEIISFSQADLEYGTQYDDFIYDLGEENTAIVSEDEEDYELEEDAQTWDYFDDGEEGQVYDYNVEEEGDTHWYIGQFMQKLIGGKWGVSGEESSDVLQEQDEQMSLFPYGQWEFPVGWEEDDDYSEEVKYNVSENVFKKIFDTWDKKGIDFSIFKLLGVPNNIVSNVYILKRYIQNTTKPIPVSYKFDCNDLAELFDKTSREYNLEYIQEYLCGDDSFWDSEDWYGYEWDDYMSDQIDEKNWKTISEIFGGVSQSVAEDILNRSSSSEEVDELTEKYEEEIDEIRSFIVWAHNDEHEWAIKNGMTKDILDKITDYFPVGRMVEDERGAKSWLIKGDLRDYINDQWDNTDTYQYHPDYSGYPIEDWLLDMTITNDITNYIFATLIEEEYRFWDYCEGKQGECLQPETKWFDGYYHPNYDINAYLADRLPDLQYEPTVTTPEGETSPLNEQDIIKEGVNPDVQEGDVIKLIYLNDPWVNITPGTKGVVMGFESTIHGSDTQDKILVQWIVGKGKFEKLPILKDVDTYMLSNELQEQEDGAERLYNQHKNDNEDYTDNSPLTRMELSILRLLHKNFTQDELHELSTNTPSTWGVGNRYFKVLKLFGIEPNRHEDNARASIYAKLAYDNWVPDGNYANIKEPIRNPLKWYNVYYDETGSQVEYKSGEAEVLAYDEEDAEEKGGDEFWDWGGETETTDYGDYETYDSEITGVEFQRIDEWLDEKPMTLKENWLSKQQKDKNIDPDSGYEIYEPLTPNEIKILNYITKVFNKNELEEIVRKPMSGYKHSDKWIKHIKLFGVPTDSDDSYSVSTRFAKWALDNWNEAQSEDFDNDIPDYSRVGTATKAFPSVYEVEATNAFWQKQFEGGSVDIHAYDTKDAEDTSYEDWYDFDPDMEIYDWGDTDDHELTVDKIDHVRTIKEDSDVFGQGLLEPSDPEEFEGDEEEWEKMVSDVEDDVEGREPDSEYVYTGGKTDPTKGYVAPSAEVTDNICKVKGFCSAQGPITFGQLKELVEEATRKRITGDMGRGLFKTIWRIVPFFIPQILLAAVGVTVTRAINKIITPALKDTRGYKEWWGKAVLKAMDIAEGDYIPDITIGDDPISKVFFISDGLLQMIRDKYKLKFARYVADVAANEPDSRPVPEWFVENLLRNYLNQKFLLDPPLPIKRGVEDEKKTIEEQTEHKESKLNPQLMIGDEVTVLDVDTSFGTLNIAERFKDYVVTGIKQSNQTQEIYYEVTPIGETEDQLLGRMLAGGGRIRREHLYPTDVWVLRRGFLRGELNEHEQPGVNPYLEEGDIIRVIDIDGEHARMPKRFGLYKVIDTTHDNTTHDFYYDIVPVDFDCDNLFKCDYLNKIKTLYRGDTWIYGNIPMASTVDRKTITEHKETKINPELMVGDEIMVVSTGDYGGYEVVSTSVWPELYKPYVVVGIKHGTTMMKGGKELEDYPYYQVEPVGMTDEDRTGAMLAGGGRMRPMYIFPRQDKWILRKGFSETNVDDIIREALNDLVYRDEPKDKHKRRMGRDLGSLTGFPIETFKNMPPPENESNKTEEEIDYLETIPVDKGFVDSADDIDQHFKGFLNSKGLKFPKDELNKIIGGVRAIILILKYHYNRPRPFQVAQAKGLKLDSENLQSASTPSYPSGHAAQGRFIGRYLSDLYPEYGNELMKIGDDIAYSRNMAKVHYPSDSEFGKLIGDEMYEYVYQPQEELELELSEGRIDIADKEHPYNEGQYNDFVDFVVNELGIQNQPPIKIEVEPTSTYTTGYYNNKKEIVKVRGYQRQLADILRSIAHELVHHKQKEDGLINKPHPEIGGPIEDEANSLAGRLVKSYGKLFPEIYTHLQEQYEKPEDRKKVEVTTQLFRALDDSFGIYPHPEGELYYDGQNMQLYSYDHEEFVPVEVLYQSIPKMVEGGIPREDTDLLVDILTDWVNSRMTFKEPQLNEQTEGTKQREKKVRVMFDNANYRIEVPLSREALCSSIPNLCGGEKDSRNNHLQGGFLNVGTPYILTDKIDSNNKYIVHHTGRVPFLRQKPTYNFYGANNQTIDYLTKTDLKRYLSDKEDLAEFFNIKWEPRDLIKFSMINSEEDILDLVKKGDNPETKKFLSQIKDVITNKGKYGENINNFYTQLNNFTGDDVALTFDWNTEVYDSDVEGGNAVIYIGNDGIKIYMGKDEYVENVLDLDENELYYYEQGRGHYSYDQPYEDVDDGELDYMGYHWSKDTLDKWNKVMRLTGNERFVHDGGGWDEGDVNEPMNSLSNDLWDQVSRDILVELGYGIGEHRQQEMEKYLNDEVLFDEDMYNQMVEIKLSWVQVLWIIGWSDSKNFSDMLDFEWNRVENDLSDVYHDSYSYSDDVGDEIDRIMNKFLTGLLEDEDKLINHTSKMDKVLGMLKILNFNLYGPGHSRAESEGFTASDINARALYFVDKENKTQIQIEDYDTNNNLLSIKVTTQGYNLTDDAPKSMEDDIKGEKHWSQQKVVNPDDLHHFIGSKMSDKNRYPEHEWKEQYGNYGVRYK